MLSLLSCSLCTAAASSSPATPVPSRQRRSSARQHRRARVRPPDLLVRVAPASAGRDLPEARGPRCSRSHPSLVRPSSPRRQLIDWCLFGSVVACLMSAVPFFLGVYLHPRLPPSCTGTGPCLHGGSFFNPSNSMYSYCYAAWYSPLLTKSVHPWLNRIPALKGARPIVQKVRAQFVSRTS